MEVPVNNFSDLSMGVNDSILGLGKKKKSDCKWDGKWDGEKHLFSCLCMKYSETPAFCAVKVIDWVLAV